MEVLKKWFSFGEKPEENQPRPERESARKPAVVVDKSVYDSEMRLRVAHPVEEEDVNVLKAVIEGGMVRYDVPAARRETTEDPYQIFVRGWDILTPVDEWEGKTETINGQKYRYLDVVELHKLTGYNKAEIARHAKEFMDQTGSGESAA